MQNKIESGATLPKLRKTMTKKKNNTKKKKSTLNFFQGCIKNLNLFLNPKIAAQIVKDKYLNCRHRSSILDL